MPVKYDWPKSDEEANQRALEFKERDPFPSIPRALLSSAEISDYVRVTGMLHPFCTERVKSASYEAHLGRRFIIWDQSGKRIEKTIKRGDPCILPANSIAFVQVEPKFRLPNYIALRFNLRITHVHRGILLGTGPLIDPGFEGDLLIPLHNLTFSDYEIDTNEALIWIEFTKTTFDFEPEEGEAADPRPFVEFPRDKMNKSPEYYLHKASGGNPIRSSIGGVIQEFRDRAEDARKSAKFARNVSIIGAVGVALALGSLIIGGYGVVTSTLGLVSETVENLARIESKQTEITNDVAEFRSRLSATFDANGERDDTIRVLRNRLDALAASVDRMEIDIQGDQQ